MMNNEQNEEVITVDSNLTSEDERSDDGLIDGNEDNLTAVPEPVPSGNQPEEGVEQ